MYLADMLSHHLYDLLIPIVGGLRLIGDGRVTDGLPAAASGQPTLTDQPEFVILSRLFFAHSPAFPVP